jgi:hypothetical protein
MQTVFSHIIQKRFSQVNEDVATDALAYVLESSEPAREGMMKLLRGIVPDLPPLRFKTQQAEGAIRPDMWGFSGTRPRVFVENKFWAGLTDNQPVSYLKELSAHPEPTVLLVVAPAAREQTLWRELKHRLAAAGITATDRAAAAAVPCSADTELGPVLALTSWGNVLSVLEHQCADDPGPRGDLVQLRALCDSADMDAFTPLSGEQLSDQRTPGLVLQLGAIVQATVDLAVSEGVLEIKRLNPQASWERIGRYARFAGQRQEGVGVWFGVHFGLWKTHGATPLWVVFHDTGFGRGREVRALVEPWAVQNGVLTAATGADFAVAFEIPEAEEKDAVVRSLVDAFNAVAVVLETLPPPVKEKVAIGENDATLS